MLDRLAARAGPLLNRASRLPLTGLAQRPRAIPIYRDFLIFAAFSILGAVIFWPILSGDYPPGVDTATFLHLSWVTKLAASGSLANPFQDPYWYGGFPYLVAYPPLGYGLIGTLSAITGAGLVDVYSAVLIMAYGGLATTTYWLAAEMGLRRWAAALAGVMAALAYPVLNAIFLWGWSTSVIALPLGLLAIMLLERSVRSGCWKPAAWGGGCMAASILTHHMTGLAMGIGLVGWFGYHAGSGVYSRRKVVVYSALFALVAVLVAAPWGIAFTVHVLDVGFRREVAGLWLPDLSGYRNNIVDSSLIGSYVYPSYLGTTLLVLATGGTAFALAERRRLAGMALVLLVLAWFSMGANLNPLIRLYPFSGLDVARFHLYIAPFLALMAAALVDRTVGLLRDLWPGLSARLRPGLTRRPWYVLVAAVLGGVLTFPVLHAWDARGLMEPYKVEEPVNDALLWLRDNPLPEDGPGSRVYAIGLWNWHAFLIPFLADQRLIDGWHDEGAPNVRQVRELRIMGWTGNVDIQRAHTLMSDLDTGYVMVKRVSDFRVEATDVFWEEIESRPELFEKRAQWGELAVFRVVP